MPKAVRLPPELESLLRETAKSFARQASEILANSVASAADDALERIEKKGDEILGRVRSARSVARSRTKRSR